MRKLFAIARYEWKMQMARPWGYFAFAFAFAIALLDCLPHSANLARVEFLADPYYFVRRVLSLDGLFLLFGLMFLLADRLQGDQKRGMRELFLALPVNRAQYVGGKFLGGFLYTVTMMTTLLLASMAAFSTLVPVQPPFAQYAASAAMGTLCIVLPGSFFVAACSVMLPEVMDIRLFYLLFSILFLVNVFAVGSADAIPFYIFTQGDMAKLIWQHPRFPTIYIESVIKNLAFMIVSGLAAIALAMLSKKHWRTGA